MLGLFLDRSELDWLEDYSTVISMGAISAVVFASLWFVPFTEQYARESTPPEVWGTPVFKRTNRLLTTMWGTVFALGAILGAIAQQTDSSTAHEWLNWIIPIALVVGAFKFTAWYAERARTRARAAAGGA